MPGDPNRVFASMGNYIFTTRALVQSLTQKHKWATVLVTHHADDIATIANKTYRLENGVLVAA